MNIRIEGFTPLQQAIADMVWTLETEDELLDWYRDCADDIKPIAVSVMTMLKCEAIDQNPIEDFSESQEIIDRIQGLL